MAQLVLLAAATGAGFVATYFRLITSKGLRRSRRLLLTLRSATFRMGRGQGRSLRVLKRKLGALSLFSPLLLDLLRLILALDLHMTQEFDYLVFQVLQELFK